MAFTAKTAFESKVFNAENNSTQHIAGKYGTLSETTYTAADCDAGQLCARGILTVSEGYEGLTNPILNGNTWIMIAATSGTAGGRYGDHTGIYAFDNYDVNKVVGGDIKANLGINTLGIGLVGGERGDFCELIVGEQYKFGAGNFASTPTVGQYVKISNGKWSASSSTLPDGGTGVYGIVRRSEPFNEGTSFFGTGYVVEIARSAEVAAE